MLAILVGGFFLRRAPQWSEYAQVLTLDLHFLSIVVFAFLGAFLVAIPEMARHVREMRSWQRWELAVLFLASLAMRFWGTSMAPVYRRTVFYEMFRAFHAVPEAMATNHHLTDGYGNAFYVLQHWLTLGGRLGETGFMTVNAVFGVLGVCFFYSFCRCLFPAGALPLLASGFVALHPLHV